MTQPDAPVPGTWNAKPSTTSTLPGARLSRSAAGLAAPPVRIVHLGLGAFHRAHRAWYTAHASDAAAWGIAAFTGRSRELVDRLAPQDGLFTLVERGRGGDRFDVVPSIVRVESGDDVRAFVRAVANPEVAILSLTVTEDGYRLAADGTPDLTDPVVASDIETLLRAFGGDAGNVGPGPATVLGRVLLALDARRCGGAGPIAVVSCDNLPDNGGALGRALTGLAEQVSPVLARWLHTGVSMVSTSVDRITPAIDVAAVSATVAEATGWFDAAPVVTEPFSDWVLCGDFLNRPGFVGGS